MLLRPWRVVALALLILVHSPLSKAGNRLTLTGSSTVAPLALEIGKRFEKIHPGVHVEVQTGGSKRGVIDARSGLVDIGMVSRALKREEHDLVPHTIALDGIGILCHRDNPDFIERRAARRHLHRAHHPVAGSGRQRRAHHRGQ